MHMPWQAQDYYITAMQTGAPNDNIHAVYKELAYTVISARPSLLCQVEVRTPHRLGVEKASKILFLHRILSMNSD